MKRLAVGILAHVDSGKTTLSEAMLYRAGSIKAFGRVDHGNAFLDHDALERERGITIFSKQAVLRLPQAEIFLLDTPGHVDFSTETERALNVLDYAVLVINAADGVQSHTETLWKLLERHSIPTMLFINKMDQPGADRTALLEQLRLRLHPGCTDFAPPEQTDTWREAFAMCDEVLLGGYLQTGALSDESICTAVARRSVFPCYFGAALRLDGVDALLSGLERCTRTPYRRKEFGASVFKIARDAQGNRLTYCKITGGTLRVKDALTGTARTGETWTEKVNQIRVYSGEKFTTAEVVHAGAVCAVAGLTCTWPGEGIGSEPDAALPVLEPVMTYRVEPPPDTDAQTLLARLRILEEEDPQLHLVWHETLGEIQLQLMGEVHKEILARVIAQRFGMQVRFGQGRILYKETISDTVEGVGHFEPLRHYAEVHLLLEPGARGSGIQCTSACSEDVLDRNWQRLVLTHLEEKTHAGVLTGAPLTDIKITLVSGKAHLKHTEGGDFRQATYRAVRQGLKQAQSVLLEPWISFRLELPSDAVGRAMSDLQRRGAAFEPPDVTQDTAVLTGSGSVARLQDYAAEVTGYTHGHGRFSYIPAGYAPCTDTQAVIDASQYDSDADTENPSDSVFCAHGAGFSVPWHEVFSHMHLPAVLRPQTEETPAAQTRRQAQAYCATLAQDKELMAIFEQTYGPIKQRGTAGDTYAALHTMPDVPYATQPTPLYTQEPEYLLVDGYNIIFAWDDLKELAQTNLDATRRQLIHMMCNYQGFRRCELIVVFDAYRVKGARGEAEQVHNISVVYTKEAETADMYIEKVSHALAKKRRVRVATSDGMEQMIILSHGALRVSASMFREEFDQVERAIRSFLAT